MAFELPSTPSSSLPITIDTTPPTVLPVSVNLNTSQSLAYTFSENIGTTFTASNITVTNLNTNAPFPATASYNAQTHTATFTFSSILPNGNYQATLNGTAITDVAGNALGSSPVSTFFFLMGDANHDRSVNASDFALLAANYGQSGKTFSQGDFNYDGTVNSATSTCWPAHSTVHAAALSRAAGRGGCVIFSIARAGRERTTNSKRRHAIAWREADRRRRHPSNFAVVMFTLDPLESRLLCSISVSDGIWAPIGPAPIAAGSTPGSLSVSGRIYAIAVNPTNPSQLYAATGGGGIWGSSNDGGTWSPLTDNQATLFTGTIAIAPSNPNVIYAGTGNPTVATYSYTGKGVLKSTDGGVTWTLVGNSTFNRSTISQIVVSPTDPNTLTPPFLKRAKTAAASRRHLQID